MNHIINLQKKGLYFEKLPLHTHFNLNPNFLHSNHTRGSQELFYDRLQFVFYAPQL